MIVSTNSIVQYVIQIKNEITKHVNLNIKIIVRAKKIIFGILAHVFVRIASIWKSITKTSVIVGDEIISVMDIISATMTNTTSTNVTKNCHNKKVRYKFDYYIFLHSFY